MTKRVKTSWNLPKEVIVTILEFLPIFTDIIKKKFYLTSWNFYSAIKTLEGILERKKIKKGDNPVRYYTILAMKQSSEKISRGMYCHICIVTGPNLENLNYCYSCKKKFCKCHFFKCSCKKMKCTKSYMKNECRICKKLKCVDCSHKCPICKKGVCNDKCSKKFPIYKSKVCNNCYKRVRRHFLAPVKIVEL